MTTFAPSPFNDLQIDSSGILLLNSGKESYADIIGAAIRTLVGELQLDVDNGIPYFETVFKNYGGIAQWENAIRSKVLSYDFVQTIKSFDYEVNGKTLSYKMIVETVDGQITLES